MRTGKRSVDLELTILANVLNFGVRGGLLEKNLILGRLRYTHASEVRHCREVAPTPEGLKQIELIGDKSGPATIALTYGDVRPDHLFKQAQRIRLTVSGPTSP